MITEEEFKRCLPSKFRGSVDDSIRARLNDILSDPNTREAMSQNLLGYTDILQQGRFKVESYVNAIAYVTYKAMGNTNLLAFKKVFPKRYSEFEANEVPQKDINSYISSYNKSKLVTLLYEQLMIPTHILNQDIFQEAINVQRDLMLNEKVSPMVRSQAAKSLMDTLRPPEIKKMQLDVAVKDSDVIEELRKTTAELAKLQLANLQRGGNLQDILNQPIIEAEVVDG